MRAWKIYRLLSILLPNPLHTLSKEVHTFFTIDLATNYKGHFFRVSPLINVKVKKDAELDNTSEPIVDMYRQTGLEAAKKYF